MSAVELPVKAEALSANALAFSNLGYVSPGEYEVLAGADGPATLAVVVKDAVFHVKPRAGVAAGTIQLSSLQRRAADVTFADVINLHTFTPPQQLPLNTVTLQVDVLMKGRVRTAIPVDGASMAACILSNFLGQYVKVRQDLCVEFEGSKFKLTVTDMAHLDVAAMAASAGAGAGGAAAPPVSTHLDSPFGQFGKGTVISLEKARDAPITVTGGTKTTARLFDKGFNFEKLGIGGLDREFSAIFRRAFASRLYPSLMREFGMNHVRGMLLYGAPGCGKTLIARKIGQALHAREPKKVNGPEILNKYVGASEENIRELFADAEAEQKERGDDSDLHIIIFDEIDAICKKRGSSRDGTGVSDSIVNQLLSKIDGVDSLNNILLIGMTNRKDMIDEALLRPGRLEVHVEIGLPDEAGRVQILNIHSEKIRAAGRLAADVDIADVAALAKNYTGAELEGLIRDALSFALERVQDPDDISKAADPSAVYLTMEDFRRALDETEPAFGMRESELKGCVSNGMIPHGRAFDQLMSNMAAFTRQVKDTNRTQMLSVLLDGPTGCGKSAVACTVAMNSGFPFVKRISADTLVGFSESAKASAIHKTFEDAYKTPLSVIILDDLERLMDYVPLGQRFSNAVLQALLVLAKRPPPTPDRRILIIATTSNPEILTAMGLTDAFHIQQTVPMLETPDEIAAVLTAAGDVEAADIPAMSEHVSGPLGIKKLLLVLEMARMSGDIITTATFAEACAVCGVSTHPVLALH